MELKCLLMWLFFGSVKGNKPGSLSEACPAPPTTEFADNAIVLYPLGTKLYYECEEGYTRRSGQYMGIRCHYTQGAASWTDTDFECVDKKIFLSTAPTVELDFAQKPGRKPEGSTSQKQENFTESYQKCFCGPPKTVPHAFLNLNKQYYVGQVLIFKCQKGFDKQPPISGINICKKVNGKTIWTSLPIECTNASSSSNNWPSQTIDSDLALLEQCTEQRILGLPQPSSSSSMILPMTAIFFVLLIIPGAFV